MSIDYDHQRNTHTTTGAEAALPVMLRTVPASSLLDVGCGTGTWLRAVAAQGITDFLGVDGVALDDRQLLIPSSQYQCHDLTKPLHLGRQFDLVLCLEVAEHLDPATAPCLVETLVNHSNQVFSPRPLPANPASTTSIASGQLIGRASSMLAVTCVRTPSAGSSGMIHVSSLGIARIFFWRARTLKMLVKNHVYHP